MKGICFFLSIFALLLPGPSKTCAINLGQVDAFESSGNNWNYGQFIGDYTLGTPGPGGATDHFLQLTGMGFTGPQSALARYNSTQWVGDYIAAGVNVIEMDVKAITITAPPGPLTIRIAFRTSTGPVTAQYSSGYVSAGFPITADGTWHHAKFYLSSLTAVKNPITMASPAPLATFLTAPGEIRVISSNSGKLTGDSVQATLGIDNIRASRSVNVASVTMVSSSTMQVNFVGKPLATYTIQSTSDLTQAFTNLGSATAAADGTFQYTDNTVSGATQRFYRANGP